VGDPGSTLARLQRFIGVPPHPSQLEVHGNINAKYFARWQRRLGRPVQRGYLSRVAARQEHRAQAFGYSLRPPFAPVPGTAAHA
jgi:hypothetical protein